MHCASALQTEEIKPQTVLMHFGSELKAATQAEGTSGIPGTTGSAWSCLTIVLCWGQARLPLVSSSLVSAEAVAEQQLVPADGKGWEKESATRGEGSNLQEESVCTETKSSFRMQVMCWFSHNSS